MTATRPSDSERRPLPGPESARALLVLAPPRAEGEAVILDTVLRPPKDAALSVAVRGPVRRLPPLAVTLAGGVAGLGAAVAAWQAAYAAALGLWLLNRVLDGLDGAVARETGRTSDLGGYLDIVSDHVVAAALALGVAASIGTPEAYLAVAVLLAAYYVNGATWMYLSALLEKRRAGSSATGEATSVTMPAGLVEGAETVVFYALVLALPGIAVPLFWLMAALVLLTAGHRTVAAVPRLTAGRAPASLERSHG